MIQFFPPVPKSHTQMGSLSAKNESEKISRLGTFKAKPAQMEQFLFKPESE